MRKKLEGNGLWESSSMMLPEHQHDILKANKELEPKVKPVFDEQEMERINDAIYRSLEEHLSIKLYMFDPFDNPMVEGIVEKVDTLKWKIRIDGYWLDMNKVIKLEILEQ